MLAPLRKVGTPLVNRIGAVSRVDPAATAFAYRYAQQNLMVFASWDARESSTGPIA